MKPYISMLKQNKADREMIYSIVKEPAIDGVMYKEKNGVFFTHDVTKPLNEIEANIVHQADCIYTEIAWEYEAGDYWRLMKEKHGEEIPHYDVYIHGIQNTISEFIMNTNKPVIIVSNKANMNKFVTSALSVMDSLNPMSDITILESKILGARCYVGFLNMPKIKTALDMADKEKITDNVPLVDHPEIAVEGFIKLTDMRFWTHTAIGTVYDFCCGVGNSFGEFSNDMENTYRCNFAIGSDINPTFVEFCRRYWGNNEWELLK